MEEGKRARRVPKFSVIKNTINQPLSSDPPPLSLDFTILASDNPPTSRHTSIAKPEYHSPLSRMAQLQSLRLSPIEVKLEGKAKQRDKKEVSDLGRA
jgi:hypothetical protein